jgi:putative oxidoreductase
MKNWFTLPLRLGLGIVFIAHGLQKVFGMFGGSGVENFATMLGNLGFAPALFWAYLAAYTELLGGICVLLGLCTRLSSISIATLIAVAAFKVHVAKGFFLSAGGFEYTFLIFCAAVALVISGGGPLSITKKY